MTLEEENLQLKQRIQFLEDQVVQLLPFKEQSAQLETTVSQLLQRVQSLEQQLATNSRNSSKPPSSDGFKRPPKARSLRQKSGKQSGGQPEHQGHHLALSDQPDQIVSHLPQQCQHCQAALSDLNPTDLQLKERRQGWDLPPLQVSVTEHQVLTTACPDCGKTSSGIFPAEVVGCVQYGPGVKALATYLCYAQLLPLERTCEVLEELLGITLSQGSLAHILQTGYTALSETESLIKAGLEDSSVIHNDETGFMIEGQRRWLHVTCTASLTHYAWHTARGKRATAAIGILTNYQGISVHDGFSSYPQYECHHASCNAHHLRELIFVKEQLGQLWAKDFITMLLSIKAAVAVAQVAGQTALSAAQLASYYQCYDELIALGLATNASPPSPESLTPAKRGRPKQSKAKNLVDRLQVHREEVLRFATNFAVPFDNNQAERDLRMMKVQQKISGGFRSEAGASYFCRIRSYISTMRKQGQSVFKVLISVFSGQVPLPSVGV